MWPQKKQIKKSPSFGCLLFTVVHSPCTNLLFLTWQGKYFLSEDTHDRLNLCLQYLTSLLWHQYTYITTCNLEAKHLLLAKSLFDSRGRKTYFSTYVFRLNKYFQNLSKNIILCQQLHLSIKNDTTLIFSLLSGLLNSDFCYFTQFR